MKAQRAPYPVGTKLMRLRPDGSQSGKTIDGKDYWWDRDGNTATVIAVRGTPHDFVDDETGDLIPVHEWCAVQFDDDANGDFLLAVDVDSMNGWGVIQ